MVYDCEKIYERCRCFKINTSNMLIQEILSETMSGGIAIVAQPMGKVIKRPNPSVFGTTKTKKKKLPEGEERTEIENAAIIWLNDYYIEHPDADYEELYQALQGISHEDIGTQKLDYFMQEPLGLNIDNKDGIVDAVMNENKKVRKLL